MVCKTRPQCAQEVWLSLQYMWHVAQQDVQRLKCRLAQLQTVVYTMFKRPQVHDSNLKGAQKEGIAHAASCWLSVSLSGK